LTDGKYAVQSASSWDYQETYSEKRIEYDLNGNLTHISRQGDYTSTDQYVDELTYHYDGNKLLAVNDDCTKAGLVMTSVIMAESMWPMELRNMNTIQMAI
jgi:hypothetical protein